MPPAVMDIGSQPFSRLYDDDDDEDDNVMMVPFYREWWWALIAAMWLLETAGG